MTELAGRPVFVLVDGENIDATLGSNILHRRPEPKDRPRWERVLEYVRKTWDSGDVRALFFLNATDMTFPNPFVQALGNMHYKPVLLSGPPEVKIVDVGILRSLDAIRSLDGDVVLLSHDADFIPALTPLLDGTRRVGLVGFREQFNSAYGELVPSGLEMLDLEYDLGAFNVTLPRIRIIPLDEFDPMPFLLAKPV